MSFWIIITAVVLLSLLAGAYFVFLKKDNQTNSAPAGISGNDASKLRELVYQWNKGLNIRSTAEVTALYAENLTYYQNVISKWDAEKSLRDFFYKNPGYNQQINGEITLERVNDNMITCNFQKTSNLNGKTTDYPSYLKFSKQGDEWKIVEEGDKITDYNIQKRQSLSADLLQIETWIKKTIRNDISIGMEILKGSGISTVHYSASKTNLDEYEPYLNVMTIKPKISFSEGWINLLFEGDDNTIYIFLGDEYVFRSWHFTAGSNGGSTSYNLRTGENVGYEFTITSIKGNEIKMYRDGYEIDETGQPLGHYWQSGTYNIEKASIRWGKKEF